MNSMQGWDALYNGFDDGLHAAGQVFVRRSQESARYNALWARYQFVLKERDHNAEIYREVAWKHNALVLEVRRLRQRVEELENDS